MLVDLHGVAAVIGDALLEAADRDRAAGPLSLWWTASSMRQRRLVWIAAGMIAARTGHDADRAVAAMRDHATKLGHSLDEVVADVLIERLTTDRSVSDR